MENLKYSVNAFFRRCNELQFVTLTYMVNIHQLLHCINSRHVQKRLYKYLYHKYLT